MALLLFRLRGVPDDEAEDVRTLLEENDIEYYETHSGSWGVSLPAIWLREDHEAARAHQLITRYQQERGERVRADFRQSVEQGGEDSFIRRVANHPIRFMLVLIALLVILYITLWPFIRL